MIAGGGTGGHLFPGIAVAEAARRRYPDAAVLFVGSARGIEAGAVPAAGFALETLPVTPLRGRGFGAAVGALGALVAAIARARAIVRRFAPDAVIGLGGYASAPAVVAGRLARRPIVLLEQNARPGLTTRVLARLADRVCVSFPDSARHLPPGKAVVTGNPVRWRASTAAPGTGRTGLSILIVGGSAGARRLNDAGPVMAAALADVAGLRVVHQTGAADEAAVRAAYGARGIAVDVRAFIADMGEAYAAADLVVCRAGATTLAELAGLGKPAILVPYPYAADDHQRANAESLVGAAAARMVLDADASGERLASEVRALAASPGLREEMGRRIRAFARPDAAEHVLDTVAALTGTPAPRGARAGGEEPGAKPLGG
jgi:UDP-N-acetylglucosamine--N-acetylmuramyl-(pentapeptide) pyrophosphoryl-undecaprenol N-acetylglucosamine transferase